MLDDDLTALRTLRRQRDADLPPEALDAALERARTRFQHDAAATTLSSGVAGRGRRRPPVPGLRRFRPVVLVGAAVVAGGLIASGVGVTHWTAPEPAAAETLHGAARAATAHRAPAGAYIRVVETEESMAYASSDGDHYDEGYLVPTTTTTWVPADVSGTWVRETRSGKVTTFYGGAAAREAAAAEQASRSGADGPVRQRAAGGAFAVGELGGEQPGALGPADIAGLPREPGALVRRIEAAPRPEDTTDAEHVYDTVSQLLRTGLVPADLRATMFDALATLPGIEVTEEQTTLDGRTGTAIGMPARTATERRELVIDPTDGSYLGERTTQTRRTGSIPAGTVIDSVAIRVASVDDVP